MVKKVKKIIWSERAINSLKDQLARVCFNACGYEMKGLLSVMVAGFLCLKALKLNRLNS